MAIPIAIPIALTLGSLFANKLGADAQQRARDSAAGAERLRQQQFDRQADAVNARARNRFDGFEDKQEDRGAELAQMFAPAARAETPSGMAAPPTSSNIVATRSRAEAAGARKENQQRAGQLAELRSFGDLFGTTGFGMSRDAGDVTRVNSFRRGSASVLPAEMERANYAGGGFRTLGDLLGMGAQMTFGPALGPGAAPLTSPLPVPRPMG